MPKIFLHKNCQTGKLALGGFGRVFPACAAPHLSPRFGAASFSSEGTLFQKVQRNLLKTEHCVYPQSPSLTTAHTWPG